ncbi:MAG: IPTL-CTERM sorting domain-containing protein [Ottowia sp.]|uniref:IPTL-CTERM sorting domain-containing protein n=1 Tax=Ottowia sp. TaxID=1898956 RepID=UPI003C7639DB
MQNPKLLAAMAALLSFPVHTALAADLAGTRSAPVQRVSAKSLQVKADAVATVYVDQSFSNPAATGLPSGWRTPAWNKGSVSIEPATGNLIIDGRADSYNMTAAILPADLEGLSNYRVDVEFTMDAANDTGRWMSVMYRTSPASGTIAHEPYHQFALRQNAAASNGTEFAYRNGGSWSVQSTKAFTETLSSTKTYRATVIVYGNRVRQYLNDVLLHDATTMAGLEKGGVGLQTAGAKMRVKSIKVTQQLTPLPEFDMPVAVQDTGTAASMAPTLVQSMSTLAAQSDGSSNSLFTLDSSLNLTGAGGQSLGTLRDVFSQTTRVTVPVVRIKDQATVDALRAFSNDVHALSDITFLSDNVQVLSYARQQLPAIRTAVDFSASALSNDTASLLKISGDTNRAGAKIALLPANLIQREFVAHLQRLLITVWASSDASSAEQAAQVLTTGVNGVLAANSAVFAEVMRKLPANTLLRKPLVVGHRGMPAGGENDENTLEGSQAAVAAGADAVENDIYITTDGHLVIMHDSTVNRTTNGTGAIESMTLAQVKALRTKTKNWQVPTLREYFQAFKNKPITHFIEIKSGTPSVVTQLKKEIAEEGVAEQSIAISFDTAQMKRSTSEIPELALGFLGGSADSGNVLNDVRNVLNATQGNNSTFNPSYGGLKRETMEAAKHRGTTFWPWTLNTAADFYKYYSWGTNGITTDYAKWASDFPVEIAAAELPAAIALNEPVSLDVNLTTQIGEKLATRANELVLLGGTATAGTPSNGTVTFTSAGTAVVLPGYRYKMGDGTYSYVIVSKPVTLFVGGSTGSVTGIPNSATGGEVACSGAVPGQTSACAVTPKPGYQLVDVSAGSDCPVGSWNIDRTVYTTGVLTGNCTVQFDFAAAPAEASLGAVGKEGSVQAQVSGGGTGLWAFDASHALEVSAASGAPSNMSFPFGLAGFTLSGGEAGSQATVELTYPQTLPTGAKYYKFGKTADNTQDHWYEYPNATISGNKVVLTLTDGTTGDDDLAANGVIRDPGGIAVLADAPATTLTPVPTLGHGALALLSGGLGLLAWRRKRQDAARGVLKT